VTLVDTSVWIDHLHRSVPALNALLEENQVLSHRFVYGELFMGRQKDDALFLGKYDMIPKALAAADEEVVALVTRHHLRGSGLGWIDCHLLASARISNANLLTHDLAMKQAWAKIRAVG
jgi:predicted nucleic acid-binding protein